MQIDCQKFGCMECCKRYWISVLPAEAEKMARSQNESLADFLDSHCWLDLQLFPSQKSIPLSIPTNAFPKPIQTKIRNYFGSLPPFVLALPGVVFKREKNGSCEFLDSKTGLCGIYPVRPNQCRLFPFISESNVPLHELYSFCAFLQEEKPRSNPYSKQQVRHQKAVFDYFDSIRDGKFEFGWASLPSHGIIRIASTRIGTLSKKQFLNLISRFPAKPTA